LKKIHIFSEKKNPLDLDLKIKEEYTVEVVLPTIDKKTNSKPEESVAKSFDESKYWTIMSKPHRNSAISHDYQEFNGGKRVAFASNAITNNQRKQPIEDPVQTRTSTPDFKQKGLFFSFLSFFFQIEISISSKLDSFSHE
jgi:hypothetical protein